MQNYKTEILILGAGAAGLTAAIYAARAGRKALVLESERAASRMAVGWDLENYPGFLSIRSDELRAKFRDQAARFGAEFVRGDAIALGLETDPKYVSTTDSLIEAKAVILATGKPMPKERQIPGEERLLGFGVSYCAVCDGPLYRGREVAAFGFSEEAVEDILALQQMGVRVHWVTGRVKDEERLKEAAARLAEKGVDVHPQAEVAEIGGANGVETVLLRTPEGEHPVAVDAVFIFREIPAGSLFAKAGLKLDHKQCLAVDRFQRTNLDGVFAAGDNTCGGLQVVAAAGEGCVAALQALAWIRK